MATSSRIGASGCEAVRGRRVEAYFFFKMTSPRLNMGAQMA